MLVFGGVDLSHSRVAAIFPADLRRLSRLKYDVSA